MSNDLCCSRVANKNVVGEDQCCHKMPNRGFRFRVAMERTIYCISGVVGIIAVVLASVTFVPFLNNAAFVAM